jgi:hydrogenase expression/formation protein HypE
MSTEDRPSLGKFGKKSLEDYVFPYLDSSNATITSPRFGSDYNAVALDDEKVLVVSTDPLAVSPQLGWERSGRLALQVITTDVAVSGIAPGYLVANWNLPPATSDETFEKIWQGFTEEAGRSEVKIAGGHTGRYEGSSFPTIGAGTAFGVGKREDLLPQTPSPGDEIFLLNHLGLEASAIFSFYFPEKLSDGTSPSIVSEVKQRFDELRPTTDLCYLSSLPGVKALHDIAEGGLLGGVQETLAGEQGQCGARILREIVKIDDRVARICRFLDLDPLKITSIGSGIALVSPDRVNEFTRLVEETGLPVEAIGKIIASKGVSIEGRDGKETLDSPVRDEFWARLSEFNEDH